MKYLNATEHMWPPYYWDEAFRGPPIELRKAVDSLVKFYSFNASDPHRIIAYRGSAFQNRGATFPQMLRNATGGLMINDGNCTQPHLCDAYKNYPAGYVGGGGALGQIDPKMWLKPGSPFGRFSYNIPPTPHYMTPEGLLDRWAHPRYNVSALMKEDDEREANFEDRKWPDLERWTQAGLTQQPYKLDKFERYCTHWLNKPFYDIPESQISNYGGYFGKPIFQGMVHGAAWDMGTKGAAGTKRYKNYYDEYNKYRGHEGWYKHDHNDALQCRKAMLIRNRKILRTTLVCISQYTLQIYSA